MFTESDLYLQCLPAEPDLCLQCLSRSYLQKLGTRGLRLEY